MRRLRSPLSTWFALYNFVITDDAAKIEGARLTKMSACHAGMLPDIDLQLLLTITLANHHDLEDRPSGQSLGRFLLIDSVAFGEVRTIFIMQQRLLYELLWGHPSHQCPIPKLLSSSLLALTIRCCGWLHI